MVQEVVSVPVTAGERQTLCEAATGAARQAYARYSHFRVGAAVLGSKGVYLGVNVENASYGLSVCAERVALANAVAHGDKRIRALAIAFADIGADFEPEEALPCGACRQWIAELAPDAEIIICPGQRVISLVELLPQAFRLRDNGGAQRAGVAGV